MSDRDTLTNAPLAAVISRIEFGTGCWEWQGGKRDDGYGRVSILGRKQQTAHRVVWTYMNGAIPDKMHLHHECRNRSCVRPDHLELISPTDHAVVTNKDREYSDFCVRGHDKRVVGIAFNGYCKECNRIRSREQQRERRRKGLAT